MKTRVILSLVIVLLIALLAIPASAGNGDWKSAVISGVIHLDEKINQLENRIVALEQKVAELEGEDNMKLGHYTKVKKIVARVADSWEYHVLLENIIYDPATSKYWAVYQGSTDVWASAIGLAYATTIEGTWTKHASNPVISKGDADEWDDVSVASPFLFKYGNDYYIIYTGYGTPGSSVADIGIVKCTDIESGAWTKSGNNPILLRGAAETWDDWAVAEPAIIWDGSKWVLFYMGMSSAEEITEQIGYATSATADPDDWTDESFTKYAANPVIGVTADCFDKYVVADPDVFYEDGVYYIMYVGLHAASPGNAQQGFYKTTDLVNFTRINWSPLLYLDTTLTGLVFRGGIIKVNSTYYMAYAGISMEAFNYEGYIAKCTTDYPSKNTNLCSGQTATAKDHYDIYVAANAVTDDEFDGWVAGTLDSWLKVDLGSIKKISKIQWMRTLYDTGALIPEDFTIQISEDDIEWTTVDTVTGNIDVGMVHTFSPQNARYIKIDITAINATGDAIYASIGEFRAFEAIEAIPPLSSNAAKLIGAGLL